MLDRPFQTLASTAARPVLVLSMLWATGCGPDRTLYLGGPILTMDAQNRVVEALAVEGDRIVAAGSEAELREWAEDGARVVDLGGRTLMPGFIDAHGHFPGEGVWAVMVDLNSPPIGSVEDLGDLVDRLAERAADTPSGRWVVGMGYDDTLVAERRHPTRIDLDRASEEHPIAIFHVSGHLAVLNSRGLVETGIGPETPDPEGGRIRRQEGGTEPDGVLEEEAMVALEDQLLAPSPLDAWRIMREASRRYLHAGVTTAQNGFATKQQIRALGWTSRLGLIPLRVILWPDEGAATEMIEGSFSFRSHDDSWLRVGAVKLLADGSIQGYTGYLSEPYHVTPPTEEPGYRGYPRIPRDQLIERVARYHEAGLQVAVHGNGDASIDDILDALEAAQRAHPRQDTRHVVIHAQMARDDQLERMGALGVVPSFFSLHTFYWGDRHRHTFMGPERAARMSPAASALARGVRFTIHCDAPVVPMEPLRLVWAAVNRRTRTGFVVGESERISVTQALRAVTIDAAWQHHEEALKGSLEPGKLADLVLLSKNPLEHPAEIDQIRVLETVVGGESAWRAQADPSPPLPEPTRP